MVDYTTTEESLNRFLAVIGTELESYKRFADLYAPQLAPGFNSVDCMYPDENRLSAVIALLLDPKGDHGQGTVFFRQFISILTEGIHKNEMVQENLKQISDLNDTELQKARTMPGLEVATTLIADSQRRIDILLHFNTEAPNGFGLAIENKPWAIDQPRQIEAYCKYLTKRYSSKTDSYNYLLIYLSGNGQPPGEESVYEVCRTEMENSGRFVIMSYSQLKEWCQRCAEKCQAPKLRYFLEDFALYIRNKFEGGIPLMEEEIVIKNAIKPDNISAAVAVGFSWPSISSRLIENLVDLAIKKADVGTCEKIIDFDINTKGSKFYITKAGWDKYSICFEFESCNVNDFCYGVMTLPSYLEENFSEEKRKLLCDEFVVDGLYAGKKSSMWPWWNYFNVPYRDWSKSDVPWIEIREGGKIVDIVADKITMLMTVCERENSKSI